jgi:sugar lactone lactonase YvrE
MIEIVEMTRVGDVRLGWGESLVWDERRQRLYFVDCQASTLHWLDDDDATLQRFRLPSMPTGIVPTDEGLLVGALDDGLHVIDPDGATTRLVASYPPELGGRCNDACADLAGNVITGKLNLGPTEGSDPTPTTSTAPCSSSMVSTRTAAPNPAAPWIYGWYEMRRASIPRAWR